MTVAWHVMPKVGALYTEKKTFTGFTLPEEYFDAQKDVIRTRLPVAGGAAVAA